MGGGAHLGEEGCVGRQPEGEEQTIGHWGGIEGLHFLPGKMGVAKGTTNGTGMKTLHKVHRGEG